MAYGHAGAKTCLFSALLVGTALTLSACGGGGGSSSGPVVDTPPPPASPPAPPPPPPQSGSIPTIEGTPPGSVEAGKPYQFDPVFSDLDGDTVYPTLENQPSWMSLDYASYTITGIPQKSDIGVYSDIVLKAADKDGETSFTFSVEVTEESRTVDLGKALADGDADLAPEAGELLAMLQDEYEAVKTAFADDVAAIFELDADGNATATTPDSLYWTPTAPNALLMPSPGEHVALLEPNVNTPSGGVALGVFGRTEGLPYLALGANAFADDVSMSGAVNSDVMTIARRTLEHMIGARLADLALLEARFAHIDAADRDAIQTWLGGEVSGAMIVNAPGTCDGADATTCLAGADILFVSGTGSADDSLAVLDAAKAANVPVVFLHTAERTEGDDALRTAFELAHGGSGEDVSFRNAHPSQSAFGRMPRWLADLEVAIDRLGDTLSLYNFSSCSESRCGNDHPFTKDIYWPLRNAKKRFDLLDRHGHDMFAGDPDARRLDRLLVLYSDRQRAASSFKTPVNSQNFIKTYFVDHIHPVVRKVNRQQYDVGSFGWNHFPGVVGEAASVNVTTKPPFRAAGVYALPGRTMTVTRTDDADVELRVRVNSQRPDSVRVFNNSGYNRWEGYEDYNRPLFVASGEIMLRPGETVEITHAYGGTVHLYADEAGHDVSVEFGNVGRHPFWNGPEDDAAFLKGVEDMVYPWTEVSLPNFEMHGLTDGVERVFYYLDKQKWYGGGEPVDEYIGAMERNIDWIHSMGGYEDAGIASNPKVKAFAARHGLPMPKMPHVLHAMADQATCSFGCGGNPYDIDYTWSFGGSVHIHEQGHSIENTQYMFDGWGSHSQTDLYMYYHNFKFVELVGDEYAVNYRRDRYQEDLASLLKESRSQDDPAAWMREHNIAGEWRRGLAIMLQILALAETEEIFDEGWWAMASMQLVQRNFLLMENEADFAPHAKGLGFEGYGFDAVKAMSRNDWLLHVWSHVLERDMTGWLEMYGLEFGEDAKAYVAARAASEGWAEQPLVWYQMDEIGTALGLRSERVDVDDPAAWDAVATSKPLMAKPHLGWGEEEQPIDLGDDHPDH